MSTTAPVVETVSRKRVIPPAELEKENSARTQPELWQFMESARPEAWDSMTLYILREDPKPSLYGGTNTLEKCPGYIVMPDGSKQPLNSREDVELAIKQKYGGKAFRLILKKTNGERICEGKCINEAPPRYPDANPPPYHPLPGAAQSDANAIASKAIDTVANQPQEAINIAMGALKTVSEIITKQATNSVNPPAVPAATGSLDSELDRAFKAAMIKKLMDPAPDPFDMFVRFKQLMSDGNGGGNSALAEKILSTAVDRFMNPAAAVTGRTTLLDLGREFIPVLGNTVKDVMHDYRLSREADVRIAELSRPPGSGQPAPAVPPSAQVIDVNAARPNPPAAAAATVNQSATAQPQETPSFQWVAQRVAKIVKNVEYKVEEAVDRVIAFLYDTDERLVALLLDPPKLDPRLAAGKQGLVQLFQYQPSLKECMNNLPRVSEFIDKFIVAATEAERVEANLRAAAPGATAANPAPADTPKPN